MEQVSITRSGEKVKKTSKTVAISKENKKLKIVANISLTPIVTCVKNVPCAKERCYAVKFYKLRKTVRNAWDKNLKIYLENSELYFEQITVWLEKNVCQYFRWHVGGDIPDQFYFDNILKIAQDFKHIRFLVFTKKYTLDFHISKIPENLTVIFSMWPGITQPRSKMPLSWMFDPKNRDERIPKNAVVCPSDCKECGYYCWYLPNEASIVFLKH